MLVSSTLPSRTFTQVKFLPHALWRKERELKIGSETIEMTNTADKFSPLVECGGFQAYWEAGNPAPWCEHWRVVGSPEQQQVRTVMQTVDWPFLEKNRHVLLTQQGRELRLMVRSA